MVNSVYLCQLKVKNYKSFQGDNEFNFSIKDKNGRFRLPQCTVFLGDNGTGKTNLLKVIANLLPERVKVEDVNNDAPIADMHVSLTINDNSGKPEKEKKIMYRPQVIERHNGVYNNEVNFVVYRGNVSRVSKQTFSMLNSKEGLMNNFIIGVPAHIGYTATTNIVEWDVPELDDINIYAYGVNRYSDTRRNLKSDRFVDTLFFNDRPLINLEEWLLQLETAQIDKTQKNRAKKRIEKIKAVLRKSELFPEVSDYEVVFDQDMNSSIKFKTPNGDFLLNELGFGYQCMLSWVFDFIKKMFDKYPDSENPLSEPAILLVDEIDLHLHPQWQRHVLNDLCKLFPATQIIVTTHSPLVIQSVGNMNLYVLKNVDSKTVSTGFDFKTFQGWSVEEILSELMELGPNLRTENYQKLRDEFEHAMNTGDTVKGIKYYEELKKMLHPTSVERDILDMDFAQLKEDAQ